jgi:AcrR family transcriptional regulator
MAVSRRNKTPQQLSAERHAVLLEAATQAFLERGFRDCSIDHISRVSGVSKTTIYRQYANKEELFETVALQLADSMADLARTPLDPHHPQESLRALAQQLHEAQSDPRSRELFRLLLAETPLFPELTRRVRSRIMESLLTDIACFFTALIAAGRMQHPDPWHAATTFTVLASGSFRPLLSASDGEREERAKLEADITLFLRGVKLID